MPAISRKKAAEVDQPCAEWSAMFPQWEMLHDVYSGSEAVRQQATLYLPRHEQEPPTAYQERVEHALVYDFYRGTVQELAGRAFSKPPQWSEMPDAAPWKPFLADVDKRQRDASNFAREWFSDGLKLGLSWVYVEISGDRPAWSIIDPRDVFAVHTDETGRITEARFKRERVKLDGFEEVVTCEIVRITIDRVEVWHKPGKKWELHSAAKNVSGVVPLVPFAPEPLGIIYCQPPLLDLAELTLTHARRLSDLETILKVASFPMLAIQSTDGGEATAFQVGPHSLINLEPEMDARYIEHSGASISMLQQSLKDLEERAASFGMRLLKRKRPSIETATARSLDSQEASAPLQNHVLAFGEALRQLIAMTARLWPKGGDAPTVALSIDFLPSEGSTQDLIALRQLGDISRFDLTAELKRRGVLSPLFDIALNEARLADEAPILSTMRKGSDHGHA